MTSARTSLLARQGMIYLALPPATPHGALTALPPAYCSICIVHGALPRERRVPFSSTRLPKTAQNVQRAVVDQPRPDNKCGAEWTIMLASDRVARDYELTTRLPSRGHDPRGPLVVILPPERTHAQRIVVPCAGRNAKRLSSMTTGAPSCASSACGQTAPRMVHPRSVACVDGCRPLQSSLPVSALTTPADARCRRRGRSGRHIHAHACGGTGRRRRRVCPSRSCPRFAVSVG